MDLFRYMEPFAIDPTMDVPQHVLDYMLAHLSEYDEYRLVYALQLGSDRCPGAFVPLLPQYLVHGAGSVWSTAIRILETIPIEYVTTQLVESVKLVQSKHPKNEVIRELVQKLTKRLKEKGLANSGLLSE